ncbi:MAG: hypothetical protein FJ266_12095 [Planctomycetes bacterium]|nr:hypothetical protein [Planctomycetota bacterium]
MNLLLRLLLIPGRIKHCWENRNRLRITADIVSSLKKQCEEAVTHGLKNHAVIYNAGLFVVLLEQDLSAYSTALYYANSKYHQQFAARGMAVVLYEGAEDIPTVFGKNYREALRDLQLADSSWGGGSHLHYSIINCFLKQLISINIYEIWNSENHE